MTRFQRMRTGKNVSLFTSFFFYWSSHHLNNFLFFNYDPGQLKIHCTMTAFPPLTLRHKSIAQKRKKHSGTLTWVSNLKQYSLDHNHVLYIRTARHI